MILYWITHWTVLTYSPGFCDLIMKLLYKSPMKEILLQGKTPQKDLRLRKQHHPHYWELSHLHWQLRWGSPQTDKWQAGHGKNLSFPLSSSHFFNGCSVPWPGRRALPLRRSHCVSVKTLQDVSAVMIDHLRKFRLRDPSKSCSWWQLPALLESITMAHAGRGYLNRSRVTMLAWAWAFSLTGTEPDTRSLQLTSRLWGTPKSAGSSHMNIKGTYNQHGKELHSARAGSLGICCDTLNYVHFM